MNIQFSNRAIAVFLGCLALASPVLAKGGPRRALDYVKAAESAAISDGEALSLYQKASALEPKNGFLYARLGQHYYKRLKDYPSAVTNFRLASEKGFHAEWAVLQLVSALSMLAERELCKGHLREAAALDKEAVSANTTDRFSSLGSKQELLSEYSALPVRSPEYQHKLLVVLVTEIRTGEKAVDGVLTPADIETARVTVAGFSKYVEALSQGAFVIDFKFLSLKAAVKKLKRSSEREYLLDLDEVSGTAQELKAYIPVFDTFLFVWPAQAFQTSKGGGGKLHLMGEHREAWRGVMQIPAMRMAVDGPSLTGASLVLHEFFHVLEHAADIKPEHGFQEGIREHFPEWKGNNEFDFYRWQFSGKLARTGWQKLNFHDRYPLRPIPPDEHSVGTEN